MSIKVMDLFAGPGGLGEGFAEFEPPERPGSRPFRNVMSVEMEPSAHATLTLRTFLRRFPPDDWPAEYEAFRRGKISLQDLQNAWPREYAQAQQETLGGPCALGVHNQRVDAALDRIRRTAGSDDAMVVIGGPPCQAYSVVGRSRNKGKKGYRPENDGRNFLYLEYLRVINRVRPEVFVMENVRGILSAKVGGRRIFEDILRDLRHPGRVVAGSGTPHENLEYRIHSLVVEGEDLKPEDYLIRSEQYGVPQTRHRVILLGVRSDIACRPGVLQPATASVTVRQMLLDLPDVRSRLSRVKDSPEAWRRSIIDAAHEMRRTVHGIPKEVRENIAYWQAAIVDQNLKASFGDCYPAGEPAPDPTLPVELRNWIRGRSNVLTGHESRSHQPQDLHRYFFAACWADSRGETPSSSEFPDLLAPDHENWKSGHFADRFRVQLLDSPSKTITCHIARDGHYYIHPLPSQCRSFTPREAARIQTFPDDYHFLGPRTSQYVQIGNAVPPWLSRQIAGIVHDLLA